MKDSLESERDSLRNQLAAERESSKRRDIEQRRMVHDLENRIAMMQADLQEARAVQSQRTKLEP